MGENTVEQYVHNLTHELKTPITGIRAASDVLDHPDIEPAETRKFLSHIRNQTMRLNNIVDRLLELAGVERIRFLEKRSAINLATLVDSQIEALVPQAKARQISFEVDIASDIVVEGDVFLLQQAVANLLDNAVSFSPENGKIEVSAKVENRNIVLTVRDHGPGVPDYALSKICERFYSLPRPGGAKSTGLGLSLVQEIARLHGGHVELFNPARGGAEARLIITKN